MSCLRLGFVNHFLCSGKVMKCHLDCITQFKTLIDTMLIHTVDLGTLI